MYVDWSEQELNENRGCRQAPPPSTYGILEGTSRRCPIQVDDYTHTRIDGKRLPSEFARDQGSADLAGDLEAFSPQVSLARAPSCKEEAAQEKTDPSSDRVSLSLPFPWNMGYEKKSQITQ